MDLPVKAYWGVTLFAVNIFTDTANRLAPRTRKRVLGIHEAIAVPASRAAQKGHEKTIYYNSLSSLREAVKWPNYVKSLSAVPHIFDRSIVNALKIYALCDVA